MRRRGLIDDVRGFVVRRAAIPTRVEYATREEREVYERRILHRVDVPVDRYTVLNIHRIVVDAPPPFVFEQFRTWGPNSVWWPNRIAKLEAVARDLSHIRVFLLGRKKPILGGRLQFFGLNVVPLFEMNAIRVADVPADRDLDGGRYMLYRCGGGYPVGIVIVYVRPAIRAVEDADRAEVFFVVGFDFYGKERLPGLPVVHRVWEAIHDRVTGNVLNRFKSECEARFGKRDIPV